MRKGAEKSKVNCLSSLSINSSDESCLNRKTLTLDKNDSTRFLSVIMHGSCR